MDDLEYQNQIKISKDRIEKNKKLFEEIEAWEQRRFEREVIENTDNFWTCE
jgi:hypothetical protein